MSGSAHRPVRRRTFVLGGAAAAGSAALAGPLAGEANAAAFGWRDDGSNYVVDTGAHLVFKVSKSNGDLTSLVYRGTEYQGYGGRNSHIESGLGSSTVTLRQSGSTGSCTTARTRPRPSASVSRARTSSPSPRPSPRRPRSRTPGR